MDSKNQLEAKEVKIPVWNCSLEYDKKEKITVGDVLFLNCKGLEAVGRLEEGEEYEFSFPEKDRNGKDLNDNIAYSLFKLSTTKDEPNEKTFRVTSYYPHKSELPIGVLKNGQEIFYTDLIKFEVQSVIENQGSAKPFGPINPGFVLPGTYQLVAIFALILSCIGYMIIKSLKRMNKRAEYKRILLKADYPDPFVDFGIDIRNLLKRNQKQSDFFSNECESVFKKLFFRLFEKPISFESGSQLSVELRRRGVPQHKIRSLYVLKRDYNLVVKKKLNEEQVTDFLNLSKQVIFELKSFIKTKAGVI